MSSNYKKNKKLIKNEKKVLDGFDLVKKENKDEKKQDFNNLIKDIRKDIINEEIKLGKEENKTNILENKNMDINDKIQSIISILFTVVIFILMFVLIVILSNKYLKKEEVNLDQVCSSYIKKDLDIDNEIILNYIKENRYILYNVNEYDKNKIDNNTINEFSKYIIWNSESDYTMCDGSEYCLDTKKEMEYNKLKEKLEEYFNKKNLNLIFSYDFKDNDATRLYLANDKVILTFKNMEYTTLKHDIVDTRIDENNIHIIFALSKKIDNNNFAYTGSKHLELEYMNNKFIIKNIKTTIN